MLKFEEIDKQIARIKVIGVGGGGSNAVDHMSEMGIKGVDFAVMNTDVQVLGRSRAPEKIQIGKKTTRGMGTGGNPDLGRQAALDDRDLIKESIEGVNILFVTAGFGGGTGTGAAPVVAQIAKELGILTVGVVTKPFTFEGKRRMAQADQGLKEFRDHVNTIVCIPNDKVFNMINQDTPLYDAYRLTDQILYQAVESISRVIILPGMINLDFADIETILSIKGGAVIGFGEGTGKDKAVKAIQSALASPLLETRELSGAKGILISIVGGRDLSLYEVNNAIGSIHEIAEDDANILIGAIIDNEISDRAMVTLIATGLATDAREQTVKTYKTSSSQTEQHQFDQTRYKQIVPADNQEDLQTVNDETISADTDADSLILREEPAQPVASRSVHYGETEDVDELTADSETSPEDEPELPEEPVTLRRENVIQFKSSQGEFFEETDPTVYAGRNLDIPAFLRKKKKLAGRDF